MKNVVRSEVPASLAAHAVQWRDELRRWIQENPNATVPDRLVQRYAQADVREALREMYRDQCCYCEGRIKDVSYDHIEHRQPKARFRHRVFDWDNLHLACPKCNLKKSDRWNASAPILDAVLDRPVEEHLTYEYSDTGLLRWPKSRRGATTVDHTDLNRDGWDGLPGTRGQILFEALKLIRKLRKNPDAPEAIVIRQELEEKKRRQYGSVISFALQEAGL